MIQTTSLLHQIIVPVYWNHISVIFFCAIHEVTAIDMTENFKFSVHNQHLLHHFLQSIEYNEQNKNPSPDL